MALDNTKSASSYSKYFPTQVEYINTDLANYLEKLYRVGAKIGMPDVYLPGEYYANQEARKKANQIYNAESLNKVSFSNPEDFETKSSTGVQLQEQEATPVKNIVEKTPISKIELQEARRQLEGIPKFERQKWIDSMLEQYDYPKDAFKDLLPEVTEEDFKKATAASEPSKYEIKSKIGSIKSIDKPSTFNKVVKGLGAGLVRGLAEAPAYEFVNPPSAGPSDPEDPVYQFERGLISQAELMRRLKQ